MYKKVYILLFNIVTLQVLLSSTVNCMKTCGFSWIKYDGNCYKFVDDKKNYYNALASCKEMDANLASINNSMENQFLNNNFDRFSQTKFDGAWIGLQQVPYKYKWSDDSPYKFNSFQEYYPAQQGDCVLMASSFDFQWIDERCDNVEQFICKAKADTNDTCKEGWVNWNENCYFFSDPSWIKKGYTTRNKAEDKCQEWGGQLASITSFDENEFIRENLIKKRVPDKKENYWIGLETDLDLKWTDGSSVVYEDLQRYFARGWGNCYLTTSRKWQSNKCFYAPSIEIYFVCKRNKTESNCTDEWVDFNDKCYYFSDQILNWYEAEEYCVNQNSHLVSIQSEEENNFVKKNVPNAYGFDMIWLGINNYKVRWSDKTPFVYHNFNHSSANNGILLKEVNKQCNYMKPSGEWHGDYCRYSMPYICKKQPTATNTTALTNDNNKDLTVGVVLGVVGGFIALMVVLVFIVIKFKRRGNDDNQTRDHMKLSSNEHEKVEKEAGKSAKNGAETA